jgi:hypothetical protein
LRPSEIGFGFGQLGLKACYLRVQRVYLQRELLVDDGRNFLILLDTITLPDRELHDRSADPSACRNDLGAFYRGKHGLLVGHDLRRNDKRFLGKCPLAKRCQRNSYDNPGTHWHLIASLS